MPSGSAADSEVSECVPLGTVGSYVMLILVLRHAELGCVQCDDSSVAAAAAPCCCTCCTSMPVAALLVLLAEQSIQLLLRETPGALQRAEDGAMAGRLLANSKVGSWLGAAECPFT